MGVPFFVDSSFKLIDELNDFFVEDLLVDGKISSKKTWKSYAYWIQDFMRWAEVNGVDWQAASKQEIVAYRNWSIEDCHLKPKTVNARLSVLKRFYNYAERMDLIPKNPIGQMDSLIRPDNDSHLLTHNKNINLIRNDLSLKIDKELPKPFSESELKQLFKCSKCSRLSLMMRLMLECGLRRGEVSSLPEKTVLELIEDAQKSGPNSEISLSLPAHICKGNKSRSVIVSYLTAMRLKQYRATVRPKFLKRFRAKNKCKPNSFWLTQLGTEYRPESLTVEIARLGTTANVSSAHPHRFRHTFATTLYSLTGDIRLVQKLLGHSHIQTTTVYEHTAAVDRMGFLNDYQKYIDSLGSNGNL